MKKKLTRKGVQYFDAGGNVQPGAVAPTSSQVQGNPGASGWQTAATPFATLDPTVAFKAVGDIGKGIAQDFTAQNNYNAVLAPTTQTDYSPYIGAAAQNSLNGAPAVGQNVNQQQNLANAILAQNGVYQNQIAGTGPNPAQAALNAQTGNNVNATAALLAGQRGASSNAGLLARQAAQQGAQTQQAAVGQSAQLQAQQQLAAQQGLQQNQALAGNVLNQAGNNLIGEQGVNNQLFTGAAGAQNQQNAGNIQNYNDVQSINSGVAQANANAVNKTLGGLTNGIGAIAALFAEGGEVPGANPKLAKVPKKDRMPLPSHLHGMAKLYHPEHFDGGGLVQAPPAPTVAAYGQVEDSKGGSPLDAMKQFLPQTSGGSTGGQSVTTFNPESGAASETGAGAASGAMAGFLANGGKVGHLKAKGGKVPGEPKVMKDDLQNDVVDAKLTPKEIVLPLSVTQADDAPQKAYDFVASLKAKEGKGQKDEHGDFKEALNRAIAGRKAKRK